MKLKNLYSIKILIFSAIFLFISIIGIELWLYFCYNASSITSCIILSIKNLELFKETELLTTFVAVLASLDVAILAIAIPLMEERKIKIQEFYQSDRLNEVLTKDKLISRYWQWILVHLLMSTSLILFYKKNENLTTNIIYLVILLVLLTTSAILVKNLINFIRIFGLYEANPLKTKSKFLRKIKNGFYSKKDFYDFYIDLIADITLVHAKLRGKNKKTVFNAIDTLMSFFKESIRGKDRYEFPLKPPESNEEENIKKIFRKVQPEDYYLNLKLLAPIIALYHEVSKNDVNNPELGQYIIEQLKSALRIACSNEKNEEVVEYILKNFYRLSTHASLWHTEFSKKEIVTSDNYLGDAAFSWYFSTAYDEYRKDNKFREEYLDSLNVCLFNILKFLITNNLREIIDDFISYSTQGSHNFENNKNNVKSKKFTEVLILLASYCLSKSQYEVLDRILNYNNPSDRDITFINDNIFPTTIDEIILNFFNSEYLDTSNFRFSFEENHGKKRHINSYMILLLLRFLSTNRSSKANPATTQNLEEKQSNGFELPVNNFFLNLKDFKSHEIYEIQRSFGLENHYLSEIEKIFEKKELLEIVEIKENEKEQFREALGKLCNHISICAENELKRIILQTRISEQKKDEFMQGIMTSYRSASQIRGLLKDFNLWKKQEGNPEKRLGFSQIMNKETLFEEWYSSFIDLGRSSGRSIAQGETNDIITKISEKSKSIEISQLQDVLTSIKDKNELFIISCNFYPYLQESKIGNISFTGKWYSNFKDPPSSKNFEGYLNFNETNIPLFTIHSTNDQNKKRILILNKNKFGYLEQYLPIFPTEDPKFILEDKISEQQFFIKIESYSENNELLEKILSNPPEWLQKEGDLNAQRDFLLQKLNVQIGIKFDLDLDENFEGYVIEIENH